MNSRRFKTIMLATFVSTAAVSKISLPAVLADNMVLQQQSEVKFWGHAGAGKTVKVTIPWEKRTFLVKADSDGGFSLKVRTPQAGGPYDITFNDGEPLKLSNILIGEVWFCAGQSNMEMPMRGFGRQPLRGANEIVSKAKPRTPVRMFITDSEDGQWIRQYSKMPQEDIRGRWLENTPDNVASCSATAYYFARYLEEVLEVPIGIMVSTLGGARIEPFMSSEALSDFSQVKGIEKLQGEVTERDAYNVPTLLYNAKVAPLTRFPVRGFLWYQGESNRDNASQYADLMTAMVKDWRSKWGGGDQMPFYFVEIAPYNYENPQGFGAALLREAQTRAMRQIANSGIISTLDIGSPNFIHPVDKATVGSRLALLALAKTYGRTGFGYASPVYKSMEVKDGRIYINVENAERGLCPMWTSLSGFEIAGEDHIFYPAYAEIETKTCRLAVSNVKVPNPIAVRYCFYNYAEASVFSIHGLPLLPFRTDNW